jgi:hypothetical protein
MSTPSKTLAMVTMVRNEAVFLPVWLRYHGSQVGQENCFVIDLGSDDGSTSEIGRASRVRVPAIQVSDASLVTFISKFCFTLMHSYDFVAYCEVDEFLVCDPAIAANLREFCATVCSAVVTAFGLDVVASPDRDAPIDWSRPILQQRRLVRPNSRIAKPVLSRSSIAPTGGPHPFDDALSFEGLFNFRLAFADRDTEARRRAGRRVFNPPDGPSPEDWEHEFARLPPIEDVSLDAGCAKYQSFVRAIQLMRSDRDFDESWRETSIPSPSLWRVPSRFALAF